MQGACYKDRRQHCISRGGSGQILKTTLTSHTNVVQRNSLTQANYEMCSTIKSDLTFDGAATLPCSDACTNLAEKAARFLLG